MATAFRSRTPLPALGMSSLVLGVIALMLGFLPILGIPLSVCGIMLGIVGVLASLSFPGTYLRWSLMGLATSILALGINAAIQSAPTTSLDEMVPPQSWQRIHDRPIAPPPAKQGKW